MSSRTHIKSAAPYVRCGIHIVVATLRKQLSDFVRREMQEQRLSYREIARRSGGLISHSTVADIVNEKYQDVSTTTIKGLSLGLNVDERRLMDLAFEPSPITEDEDADDKEIAALFYEYKDLTDDDKQELRTVFDMVRQEIRRRRAAGELASQKNSKKARLR